MTRGWRSPTTWKSNGSCQRNQQTFGMISMGMAPGQAGGGGAPPAPRGAASGHFILVVTGSTARKTTRSAIS
jgi:hypothetical protein